MRNIYRKWKYFAEKVGNFQIQAIFSLLYFFLLTPVGIIASRLYDLLGLKNGPVWNKVHEKLNSLEELKNQ